MKEETELKGGLVNYYLVEVKFPQRNAQQAPYTAECEDIIHALNLTFDEANIFKEIWRSANARQNNGKPGHNPLYGAQKMLHYSKRILRHKENESKKDDNFFRQTASIVTVSSTGSTVTGESGKID